MIGYLSQVCNQMDHLPGHRVRQAVRRVLARLPGGSQQVHIDDYTMLSKERLYALERSIQRIHREGIPGDVAECGTCRGGSAALMALWLKRLKSDRKIYVFDTFEGLPPPTRDDPDYDKAAQFVGKCHGALEQVQELFRSLGVLDRAVFVKGLFQDTLPVTPLPTLALLHLDGDWYESTRVCLDHLWDRVSPGGIIQIDDYGAWEGCSRAVDEFFREFGITSPLHTIDYTGRWVQKTGERSKVGSPTRGG